MKKMFKLLSLFLSVTMVLISAVPFAAHASQYSFESNNSSISPAPDNVLYSVHGSSAPIALQQELAALNIHTADNTLIEVVSLEKGDGTALVVTNSTDDTVMKDIIFALDGNGQIGSIQPIEDSTVMPRSGYSEWFPNDSNALVRATAVYEIVYEDEIDVGGEILLVGPRYQPTGVYFIYYQSASTNEVATYVSVNYACVGFLYTYPGGTPINASSLTYRNTTVEKSNPASNTIYQKMSNFPTSQAIETDSAMPLGGGQFLSFNIVTNLGTYTDGVSF